MKLAAALAMSFCCLLAALSPSQGAEDSTGAGVHATECSQWNTRDWFKKAGLEEIQKCLAAGADPNARDAQGETPLSIVTVLATNKNPAVIRVLVDAGADPNARNRHGWTILYRAASQNKDPEIIRTLIHVGADLGAEQSGGWTPLHIAAANNKDPAVIMTLLEAGADPHAPDEEGKTPWDLAKKTATAIGKHWRLVATAEGTSRIEAAAPKPPVQLGMAPKRTPTHMQVDCANWNTGAFFKAASESDITRCLKAGADPNARDWRDESPLWKATIHGTAEAVTALLQAGANPNVREVGCMTPLHIAAALWRSQAGRALLAGGADPGLREINGKFPFDLIPDGIGTILRLQAEGRIPPGGRIGGRQQTDYYSKLDQGKFSQVRRLRFPNPVPPGCSESGHPLSIPFAPRRNRPGVR